MKPETFTLLQMVVAVVVAAFGSSVLAALVTARFGLRVKHSELVDKIQTEVRADLRKEVDEAEVIIGVLRDEQMKQLRLLDRVVDKLEPFARNVARLCHIVRLVLPPRHRHLADDVLADTRRLLELLGQADAAARLDLIANEVDADVGTASGTASGTPAASPSGGA